MTVRVLRKVLDEGCEGGVVELDGAPLAAFGERVARGDGAQHVNLLRASLRRHAVQQLLHRGRRLPPIVDVHAYGLGDLFAAGDGFQFALAARLLPDARRGGHHHDYKHGHQREERDERVAAFAAP